MNEIKFRAWDKIDNKFLNPKEFIIFGNGLFGRIEKIWPEPGITMDSDDMKNIILTQFTGLKDSKFVEIYEGDILKSVDEIKHGINNICLVKYKDSGFWAWAPELNDFNGDLDSWINYDTEVIGNIYENPELLK